MEIDNNFFENRLRYGCIEIYKEKRDCPDIMRFIDNHVDISFIHRILIFNGDIVKFKARIDICQCNALRFTRLSFFSLQSDIFNTKAVAHFENISAFCRYGFVCHHRHAADRLQLQLIFAFAAGILYYSVFYFGSARADYTQLDFP